MAGSDQQRQEPPPQPAVDGNSDDCRDQQGEAAEGWDAAPADLLLSIFRVLRPEDLLACRVSQAALARHALLLRNVAGSLSRWRPS